MEALLKGTLKIIDVEINPRHLLNLALLAGKEGLTPLPEDKRHLTVIHQSVLKDLSKRVKKGYQMVLNDLPEISLDKATYMVVSHEDRKTLRLVLSEEDQVSLGLWRDLFCENNGVVLDDLERNRIFHISYANVTGNVSDSVR